MLFWAKLFWTPSKAYLSAISKIQKLPLPHENYLEDDFPDWIDDYGYLEGIIPIADLFKFKFEGRGLTPTYHRPMTSFDINQGLMDKSKTSKKAKLTEAGERI